jgi:membrane protein implicated in regulation of membrane protease activity
MNPAFAPWGWAIAAVVLAGLELHAPGAYFIWLAGAAAATAGLAFAVDTGWEWQIVHFVLLGVIAVLLGRQFFGHRIVRRLPGKLNRRAEAMIGTTVTVVEPIAGGAGRVQVGDSPWPAAGPDMAAGTLARIVRVEGTTLVVDQA